MGKYELILGNFVNKLFFHFSNCDYEIQGLTSPLIWDTTKLHRIVHNRFMCDRKCNKQINQDHSLFNLNI